MEVYWSGGHLPLDALKWGLNQEDKYQYIRKRNIPTYPRPELHVSHVSHSTDLEGLQGIQENGGFRNPYYPQEPEVVWFSLTPSPAELRDAGYRDMTLVHPGGRVENIRPSGVQLQDFATSPAFSSSSRYGSFRFTFSLSHVLNNYSAQFCGGAWPDFRVYRTVLYKKEVMYVVLVHRPNHWWRFSESPLLEDTPNSICAFRAEPEPHFVWRPQAMSGTHRFGLVKDFYGDWFTQEYANEQYYVWDHVALALLVDDRVLKFGDYKLRESVRFCKKDAVTVPRNGRCVTFQGYKKAGYAVSDLWPYHRYYYLQRFDKSYFHIQN